VLGKRNAELALLLGQKYTADEAVKIGMVDRACEANELMPLAHEEMKRWLAVPGTLIAVLI
jgi:enoyl-CoA hydratase/carnithine racemase